MAVLTFPGVFVEEEQALGAIANAGVLATGFVGESKKGPVDKAGLVFSFEEFQRLYGSFYKNKTLPIAVKRFFDRAGEGNPLYISRAIGASYASSAVTIKDANDTANALTFTAFSPGLHGNQISVDTAKYQGQVKTLVPAAAATELEMKSVLGIEIGDWIVFQDSGSVRHAAQVKTVDVSLNKLTFKSITFANTVPVDTVVKTASRHRVKTELAADIATGATTATVVDGTDIIIGSIISFVDDQLKEVVVTEVNGNIITFAALTLTGNIVAGTKVVSQEFSIELIINGVRQVTSHDFLSMEETNLQDYVEVRLKGKLSESIEISVTDDNTTEAILGLQAPLTGVFALDTYAALIGGLDGAAVDDVAVLGSNPPVGETRGLGNFDAIQNLPQVAAPGFTSVVVEQGLNTFAKGRGDSFAIIDAPLADDTVLELVEFRDAELNIDSSYSALYAPFLIINNPAIANNQIEFPPSADVAGKMVETIIRRGLQKAPANEVLDDVLGLTAEIDDGGQGILNPKGVNAIRNFPGSGIRIFGGRTLLSRANGFHYINIRKQFNFIKSSLKESMQSRLFEPITDALFDDIRDAVTDFFDNLLPGGFFASTVASRAYFVKIDSETNPPSLKAQGRVQARIGVNLPRPAEFIEFSMFLSQQDGVEFSGI